ncbi:MAG: phosphoheptose isomerase, partial [Akkermansiaceae bacterium]|nr:phosphoheptose isomerase [Akkermansiaceae bacterium]
RNVLLAMRQARKMGIASAAFTGAGGGAMKDEADVCLAVPSSLTNHIQEMHIACGHLVCEYIERSLYG